jgi:hypothetical protein
VVPWTSKSNPEVSAGSALSADLTRPGAEIVAWLDSQHGIAHPGQRASLRVGQSGIDATGERADVVAQRAVGAVGDDPDGGQDERVFRYRLATRSACHRLTSADEHFRH